MSPHRWIWLLCAACLFVAVALPGCNTEKKKDTPQASKADKTPKTDAHEDHNEIGPHGGPVAEWKPYHAEFTVDHAAKTATIFILDAKLKDTKIDAAKITKATLTITSEKPNVVIELKYDAKASGDKGTALVGADDVLGKEAALEGLLKGTIDGTPHSDDFKYEVKKKDKAK